jgi:hypothetical protein
MDETRHELPLAVRQKLVERVSLNSYKETNNASPS